MRLFVTLSVPLFCCAAMAFFAASFVTPVYRSNFVLLVDEAYKAENEAAILRGQEIADKIIERYELAHDAEFNPALTHIAGTDRSAIPKIPDSDPAASIVQTLPGGFKSLSVDLPVAATDKEQGNMRAALDKKVMIDIAPNSDLIKGSVFSADAAKAQAIAQGYLDFYLARDVAMKEAAEIPEGYTAEEAREDLASLQSRIDNPDKLVSPIIVTIAEERKKLVAYIERLSQRYKEKHPKMIKARQSLEKMDQMIKTERLVLRKAVERDMALTQRRLDHLSGHTESAHASPRAKILSAPNLPSKPYSPDKPLWLLWGGLVGVLLGGLYYLLTYKRSKTVCRSSDLAVLSDSPVLGAIPFVRPPRLYAMADAILAPEKEIVAQAVRSLNLVLSMKLHGGKAKKKEAKLVTVTSAYPGEGKTILALWLARIAAQKNIKVALVDADLRQEGLHHLMEYADDVYLSDVLEKDRDLKKALYSDPDTPLNILFSRPHSDDETIDIITAQKFDDLVVALKKEFDLIIFDSPATLAAPDARALSAMSDLTLFAVAWRSTPIEMIKAGLKQFENLGYENLAFVLTKVKVPFASQEQVKPPETNEAA